jgi:hypothetical protein
VAAAAHPTQKRTAALVVLGVAYSLIAAATTPFSKPADVLTAVPIVLLALLVAVRWPWRPVRPPSIPAGGRPYRAWLVLAAAVAAWELFNYLAPGSRAAHPTLSSMADAFDRSYPLKALAFFGWLSLGALIVRQGAAGTPS